MVVTDLGQFHPDLAGWQARGLTVDQFITVVTVIGPEGQEDSRRCQNSDLLWAVGSLLLQLGAPESASISYARTRQARGQ